MTAPLTFEEVDNWPTLGPQTLDPQRVRALLLEVNGQTERADMAEARLLKVAASKAAVLEALELVLWMAEKWAEDGNDKPGLENCANARAVIGKAKGVS